MSSVIHIVPDRAIFDPKTLFVRPMDIVREPLMSLPQKRRALDRWAKMHGSRRLYTRRSTIEEIKTNSNDAVLLKELAKAQAILMTGEVL
jgi:hypothetical protein